MVYTLFVLFVSLSGIYFNCKFIHLLHKSPYLPGSCKVYLQNLGFASLCYCIGAFLSFIATEQIFEIWEALPIPVSEGTYCYTWFILEVIGVIVKGHSLLVFTVDRLLIDVCPAVIGSRNYAAINSFFIWVFSVLMVTGSVMSLEVSEDMYASQTAVKRCEITQVANGEWLSVLVVCIGATALITVALFSGLYRKITSNLAVQSLGYCEPSTFSLHYNSWLGRSLVQLCLPFIILHSLSFIPLICIVFWYQGALATSHHGEIPKLDMSLIHKSINIPFLISASLSPCFSLGYKTFFSYWLKVKDKVVNDKKCAIS